MTDMSSGPKRCLADQDVRPRVVLTVVQEPRLPLPERPLVGVPTAVLLSIVLGAVLALLAMLGGAR